MTNLTKKVINMKDLMDSTKNIGSEEVTLNNMPLGYMGFASEEDKQEGLRFLQAVVDATDGTPYAVASKAMELMGLKAKGVRIDEIVSVNGQEFYLNLKEYVAYNKSGDVIAKASEIKGEKASAKVVKALLMAKINKVVEESYEEEDYDDDYDNCDGYDDYDDEEEY